MTNSFGGAWTIEKLRILERYLDAYTTVLKFQRFHLTYFDAFAGEGTWSPGSSYTLDDYADFQELYRGSPRIALDIQDRPFDRLVFVEKNQSRSESLAALRGDYPDRNIEILNDDANAVIPEFCRGLGDMDRAVVFLDPFATDVAWSTVESIAGTEKIDCWILFPLGAVARLMPRNGPPPASLENRFDVIFGGRSHWEGLYTDSEQLPLTGFDQPQERAGSDAIAQRYRGRLADAFVRVAATRRTLRNSKNSPMFELFFAASNERGAVPAIEIADHILAHW